MPTIAITGRNRVGKTTLARELENFLREKEKEVRYFPFAMPLKKELISCGFPEEFIFEKSKEARRLMQAYGDAKRKLDPNYFLRLWEEFVLSQKIGTVSVSDDLYHLKELSSFSSVPDKKLLILVIRPSIPPPSKEDLQFKSVAEAEQIMLNLLNDDGAIHAEDAITDFGDFDFMYIVNGGQTVGEYKKYLHEKILDRIYAWIEEE